MRHRPSGRFGVVRRADSGLVRRVEQTGTGLAGAGRGTVASWVATLRPREEQVADAEARLRYRVQAVIYAYERGVVAPDEGGDERNAASRAKNP